MEGKLDDESRSSTWLPQQGNPRFAPYTHLLVRRAQPVEQGLVALRLLMEHACVDSGGQQIIGSRNSVDVPCEVQVELLLRREGGGGVDIPGQGQGELLLQAGSVQVGGDEGAPPAGGEGRSGVPS